MANQTNKRQYRRLVGLTAVAVIAAAGCGLGFGYQAKAALSVVGATGAESKVNVTVDAAVVTITKINGVDVSAGVPAVDTRSPQNDVHFKVSEDAHVKIVLGDKVLWEGDAKADQPINAHIDLNGAATGIYDIAIRASKTGVDEKHYTQQFFRLNYRPTIPSIIPDNTDNVVNRNWRPSAPNTGLYVTVGGHVYSMTTVAFLAILVAVMVYLIANKFSEKKKVAVTAKTSKSTKTIRKKMDLI